MTGIQRFITIAMATMMLISFIVIPDSRGDASGLTREQKRFLQEKGTVVFVSQTHYPPFEFVGTDGDHTGMCVELIRWIATELGFKAHFTDTSFKQAQDNILSGKADVLTSFFYSKKRDELFDFTPALFEVPASIFIDASRPDIKEIGDLHGKVVAMQAGDYAKEFLEAKNIACTFNYTRDFAQATDLVISGKADAIIGDEQIVLYHIFSNHLTEKIKKIGDPLYIGQNCMGLKEPGGELLTILNTGIAMAREKGVLDQINKKWLGTTYSHESHLVQKMLPYLLILLGSVFLVSMLVWIWNVKLRQKVASRTADLAKSEKTLRTILNASPMGIALTEGKIIKWYNPMMCRMLGYDSRELIGETIERIYRDEQQLERREQFLKLRAGDGSDSFFETLWFRRDGSPLDCRLRLAALNMDGREMTIAIAEDITLQKQSGERLRESESFLNAIIENIPDMIFVKEADSLRFVRLNRAGEDLIGYSRSDLIGKNDYDFFTRAQADFFIAKDRDTIASNEMTDIPEETIQTRLKGTRILHTKKIPLYDDRGKPQYLLGISEDITERKQTENRMKASLKEKEMLLREVHHRVKNNMQVISSLLSLQEEKITSENAYQAFKDSQNRIQSIALVHEVLYQSDAFSELDVKSYLDTLIHYIQPVYAPSSGSVTVTSESDYIRLKIDHAIPFGLVITELLTNAMKYGVMEGQALEITITARKVNHSKLQVRVADNGPGLCPGFRLDHTGTLGLNLVKGLIEDQLEGVFYLDETREKGTCWVVEWPESCRMNDSPIGGADAS